MKRSANRNGLIAFAFALLVCLACSFQVLRHLSDFAPSKQIDFNVYYVAADLVHHGSSIDMYDDAGTGVDPQMRFADTDSRFGSTGRQHGLAEVQLYVYPPFLADVMVPFTFLPLPEAALLWRVLNLFVLVLTAALMAQLLGLRIFSLGGALIAAGLAAVRPVWIGIGFGQVTELILLLWIAATWFYVKDRKAASAFLIAVAVIIKLTPLILLAPMLIWRDWRWTGWFAGALAVLVGFVCLVNGPQTLLFFVQHVMPSMTDGMPNLDNKTILSALQMVWHGSTDFTGVTVPREVILAGKLLSAAIIGYAVLRTAQLGKTLPMQDRIAVIAAFSLLSACVAPVSWQHAYAIAYFMLAVMWRHALGERSSLFSLVLVFATTLAICSISFTSLGRDLGPPYLVAYLAPIFGILLCIQSLSRPVRHRAAFKPDELPGTARVSN
jgi:hypothetical protein